MVQVSVKRIKGMYLYENGETEPCGVIRGVYLSKDTGAVDLVLAETASLIPISRTVSVNDIEVMGDKRAVLKKGISFKNNENVPKAQMKKDVLEDDILNVIQQNNKTLKKGDMRFDFETGEITELVVKNGFFRKKNKIPINKIRIKDNTIYID